MSREQAGDGINVVAHPCPARFLASAGACRCMPISTSVFLNVTDMAKSLAFYRALGFRVVSETKDPKDKQAPPAWVDLALGRAELGLGAIESNPDPEFQKWVSTPLGAGVVIYFQVANVDRFHEKAKRAGAVVEHAPVTRSYGRVSTVNDPDGYTLTFIAEAKQAAATVAKEHSDKSPRPKKAAGKRAA